MMKPIALGLTAERLRELLSYNPKTGQFTRLRKMGPRLPGEVLSGSANKAGYLRLHVDGRLYYAHRLAWLYMTGRWPAFQLDHRNCIKFDNRWGNLRESDDCLNQANRPYVRNRSGFKGVRWSIPKGKWWASLHHKGKLHSLGYFDDPLDAHKAYVEAAKRIFGEYARAA